jgi:ssDNA-binding Zn-finger/Zn-ribbon topoisomerase 1
MTVKFEENLESDIQCPVCIPPRSLIVKTNRHTTHQFLGCPNYPDCDYTRGIPQEWIMRAQGQPDLFNQKEDDDDDSS